MGDKGHTEDAYYPQFPQKSTTLSLVSTRQAKMKLHAKYLQGYEAARNIMFLVSAKHY